MQMEIMGWLSWSWNSCLANNWHEWQTNGQADFAAGPEGAGEGSAKAGAEKGKRTKIVREILASANDSDYQDGAIKKLVIRRFGLELVIQCSPALASSQDSDGLLLFAFALEFHLLVSGFTHDIITFFYCIDGDMNLFSNDLSLLSEHVSHPTIDSGFPRR